MNTQKNFPLVLIPAAGFGRRVGSPPAKELLPRPSDGHPLIEWPLRLADKRAWPIHVITRTSKASLIQFLQSRQGLSPITIQTVEETREWPETIMASHPYWQEWNLLLLPDVHFSPTTTIDDLWRARRPDLDLLVGTHLVNDPSKWGILRPLPLGLAVAEKVATDYRKAWGFFFFRKPCGMRLLTAQLDSTLKKTLHHLPLNMFEIMLGTFIDLTRERGE